MKRLLWGLFLLVWIPGPGYAQSGEQSWENLRQLRPGQKVEVIDMKMKSLNGAFVSFTEEAILLQTKQDQVTLTRADVLRVSDREHSKRRRNTLIGIGIGAAGGLAAGTIAFQWLAEEGSTGVFMLGGLSVGAGAGALVGAAIPTGAQTIYRAKKPSGA